MSTLFPWSDKEHQADDLRNSGRTQEAIALYQELFTEADAAGAYPQAGSFLQMIGVSHKIDNKTDDAIAALQKAAEYYKAHHVMNGLGNTLRDIGITYEYVDRFDEAESNLREALDVLKNTDDTPGYAITLAKLGKVQTRLKQFDAAQQSLTEAARILQPIDRAWFYYATTMGHQAALAIDQEDFAGALKILQDSEAVFAAHTEDNHSRRLAQVWGGMALCYAEQDDLASAKTYLHKSLNIILSDDFSLSAAAVLLNDIQIDRIMAKLKSV
jgi:tetratricopeptide (TPR) repeat protein